MTDEDFVNEIIEEQENTRADIRALKEAIDQLRVAVAENSKFLREIVDYQAARDKREMQQIAIAETTTQIASTVVTLAKDEHLLNLELTAHLKELRLSTAVDKTMEILVSKIKGVGVALDKSSE